MRKFLVAAGLVAALALTTAWGLGTFSHPPTPPETHLVDAPDTVTVGTFNIYYGTNPAEIAAVVERADIDVIALQETVPAHHQAFEEHLSALYPFQEHRVNGRVRNGPSLLSKFPLSNCEHTSSAHGFNGFLRCTVSSPIGVFDVLGVHLHPISGVKGLRKISILNGIQHRELEQLLAMVSSRPTLVVGDLNVPHSYPAHEELTAAGFSNASTALGVTPGDHPTWSGTGFGITASARLDFIYTSNPLEPQAIRVFEGTPSDHDGVVARVGFDR